jgi:hypothetical protein
MTTHKDTGARCLHVHYEGYGCECGAEVRPHKWREHIGAAVEALSAKRDAEAAVIAEAKEWAQREEADALDGRLARAVAALIALEGDA